MPAEPSAHTLTITRPTALRRYPLTLNVISGPDSGKGAGVDRQVRVGTHELAGLRLTDPKVSGLHFELRVDAELRVRDLGSKNGTFVGGVRVIEAILSPGEVITA